MRAKRKGSLLLDALLGMMILLVGIVPLVSSLTFAYGALTSSVEKRARLDEIYSATEQAIATFSMPGGADFRGAFDKPVPTGVSPLHGGHGEPPPYTHPFAAPRLFYKEEPFGVGWRDKNSVLRVHIVR